MSPVPPSPSLLERAQAAQAAMRTDPDTARRLAAEVIATAGAGDAAARAAALLVQATLWHRDTRHADAMQVAREALELARKLADLALVARCQNLLGLFCNALGDDRAALEYFHASVRNAETAGDARGRAMATANTAMVMHAQGDLESALKVYRELLTHPQITGNPQSAAQTRHNLAQTLWDLGRDLPECVELFVQAAADKRALGDRWSLTLTLCSLSGVQRDLQRFEAARSTLTEVATLVEGEPSHELRFFHQLNLGVLLTADANPARDLTAAQTALEAALAISLTAKRSDLEARAREHLADARIAAGRHAEACDELKAAARLRQENQRDESRQRIERLRVAFDAERARNDAAHERRQREEAEAFNARIQEQNRRLETLNREKSDIIGLIAHDLRAPLAAALELTEELIAAPGDQANVTGTALALQASQRQMLELTQSLLDIEALESGALRPAPGPVEFAVLFAELQRAHAGDLAAKAIRLEVILPPGGLMWHGPALLIERAVDNLLSNAVKYTPHGRVIRLAVAAVSTGLEVRVADSGPGIPSTRRDRMFEKFATLGTAPTGGESATASASTSRNAARGMPEG